MNIYDEAIEKEVYKEHISHEAIRLIAKEKLHWSGGRIEVLRYVDEQQAEEERAKKVEELLGLYREYRKGVLHYMDTKDSSKIINSAMKITQLEEELK